MSRKINLDYIVNMSDEELHSLNRKQLIYRLKKANELAIDRRNEALEYYKENPTAPRPTVYKYYTKTVKPKKGHIDWVNYDFDFENGETLNSLRHKLIMTRMFLSEKTTSVSGWYQSLRDFSKVVSEKTGIDIDLTSLNDIQYKRLWRVYSTIQEEKLHIGTKYENDSKQLIVDIHEDITGELYGRYGVDRLFEKFETVLKTEYESKQDDTHSKFSDVFKGMGRQG